MKAKQPRPKSVLEERLAMHLKAAGIDFTRGFQAIEGRKYEWDFRIWQKGRADSLLVECQGATHVPNRGHTSGTGLHRDYAKNNLAILNGYRVLYFDKEMIDDGTALRTIEECLGR